MLTKVDIIKTMFAANAEAMRIRDREWREWLERQKMGLAHSETWDRIERADPPPDRK